MAYGLTDSLKHNRFSIVSVDKAAGTVRVRGEAEVCTDLNCGETVVVTDEGTTRDLEQLYAGDIVTLEQKDGRAQQIRVVRRVCPSRRYVTPRSPTFSISVTSSPGVTKRSTDCGR